MFLNSESTALLESKSPLPLHVYLKYNRLSSSLFSEVNRPRLFDISEDISSPKACRWIMDRMALCFQEHEECQAPHSRTNPTRLLSITSQLLNQPHPTIKLVDQFNEPASYVALSHCWGGAQPLRTVKSNFQSHKVEIPWPAIPQTFKDAIILTQKLEIPYIWIDSLCIIQDDLEDWKVEASRMCDVYSHCKLNIFASNAANSEEGCINQRDPMYQSHVFKVELNNGQSEKFCIQRVIDHGMYVFLGKLDSKHPIYRRAWALQERLLSPRSLHISKQELVWECQGLMECDCGWNKFNSQRWKRGYLKSSKDEEYGPHIGESWRTLVEAYSTYQLTYPSDRLAALEGLVCQFRTIRPDRYAFGIWERSLTSDLQWIPRRRVRNTTPPAWIAPSWSWAAMNREISYLDPITPAAEIRFSDHVFDEYNNVYQDLERTATLQAHGYVVEVQLEPDGEDAVDGRYYKVRVDGKTGSTFTKRITADMGDLMDEQFDCGLSTFCLKLSVGMSTGMGEFVRCLILRQVDVKSKIFKRIGFCSLTDIQKENIFAECTDKTIIFLV
jgi:heterokaryon incompatibility protein (HET)